MPAREIQQNDWPDFLRDFARRHETWLVDVDSFRQPAGQPDQVARGLRLNDIAVDGDTIRLVIRRSDAENIIHQVFSPSRVNHILTEDGRGEELEIQGANAATVIKFRSGAESGL